MATITLRKDVQKWRVQIRKKNKPAYSHNFDTYEEAKQWVNTHESLYLINPTPYLVMKKQEENSQNPTLHPMYKTMYEDFKKIIDNHFSGSEVTNEMIVNATQEIYQQSLKYKTKESHEPHI